MSVHEHAGKVLSITNDTPPTRVISETSLIHASQKIGFFMLPDSPPFRSTYSSMASSLSVLWASPGAPKSTRTPPPLSLPSAHAVPSFLRMPPRRPPSSLRPLTAAAALQVEQQKAVEAESEPSRPPPSLPFRVGHGFDLHRLEPGLPLIIGGIDIPHDRGCEAHSDGIVTIRAS